MAKMLSKTAKRSSMSKFLSASVSQAALQHSEDDFEPTPLETKPELRVVEPVQAQSVQAAPVIEERKIETPRIEVGEGRGVVTSAPAPRLQAVKAMAVKKREMVFSEKSDEILEELVSLFKQNGGSTITTSNVVRGILLALDEHFPEIRKEIAALGPLPRPGNERKFNVEREAFDRKLGAAIVRAVSKSA